MSQSSQQLPAPPRRVQRLLLACALLAPALATAHAFGNELVWDDLYVIGRGEQIHHWSNLPALITHRTMYVSAATDSPAGEAGGVDTWRPMTLLTFMWDASLSGRDPTAYHATNLLLHLGCVLLVYLLALRLLPARHRALAPVAALWFGLTPLLAEGYVWIDGRSDPLCTLLGLAALLVWRRGLDPGTSARRRRAALAVSALLFLLGLLSKEVLLMALPAAVMWPRAEGAGATGSGERLRRAGGLLTAGAVYLGLRAWVLSGLRTHQDSAQLLSALLRLPALLLDGLAALLVPTRVYVRSMLEDYDAVGSWGLGALWLPVLVAAVLLVVHRRRFPLLSWGALLYASTLAPAAIIATLLWPGFGRYLYLPAAGVAIGLTAAVARLLDLPALREPARRRKLLAAGGALYLLALGLRLHLWVYDWHDELTLWRSVAEAQPERAFAHGWLGMTYLEQHRPGEAIEELLRADQLAPERPRYLKQLGWAFYSAGDTQASLNVAATGIRRYGGAPAFQFLAAYGLRASRPDLTVRHLLACLHRAPAHQGCRQLVAELCADPSGGAAYRAAFDRALSAAGDPGLERAVRPLLGS